METGLKLVKPNPAAVSENQLPDAEHAITSKPVRIIEILNPFYVAAENGRLESTLAPLHNESIGAIVCRAERTPEEFKISVNGGPVADDEIWRTAIQPGQEIVLYPRAAGGSFGKQIMGLLIVLAGAVAGMLTAGAALFLIPSLLGVVSATALFSVAGVVGAALLSWALSPGQPSSPAWSTTYDSAGPKGLAQAGTPVPKGYGTMGWNGNIVSSYVDFDGASAYLNVLVCYGWGVAKSVNNPLINLQPISNYVQCSYQVRLGTNDQPAIDGFDKTVNGYPQEIQLLVSHGPVTISGTGTNIQGLDITTKLPSGLYRITNDGNQVPLKVIYQIQVAPHGTEDWITPLFAQNTETIKTTHGDGSVTYPTWVVVPTDRFAGSGIVYATDNGSHNPGDPWTGTQTVTIYNLDSSTSTTSATFKGEWQLTDPNLNQALVTQWWEGYRIVEQSTLSAYFDTVSVYGLAAGQWDVSINKIGYCQDNNDDVVFSDSTDSKHICDIWLWNINEIFWSNLTYPNMILVGVKALATSQLSGADIQLMCSIVHDIGADTVLPSQLATFEHDNPAIVAYDVLTNPVYGMKVPASMIDVPAFVAWANFNDETVTNQDGTTTRRHIFAGVFDQNGDAWKTLQTIGNMSRAIVIPVGTRYSVILDAPADPVQLFTVGNTKKDSFTETYLALDDRCNLIECDFADAKRTYRMDLPVSVMTEADVNSVIQPKVTRTKLLGCTSRDQAWRWAYFTLMSTKLALRTIQFSAGIESVCCGIGSVIAMQSDVVQWGVGGRVQYGSTSTVLNVERTDLTFAPAAGWTVSVQHPAVQRGTAAISYITGLVLYLTAPIPAGRILKAIGPDGTEYVVTGTTTNTLTLAYGIGTLAAGQSVTLYDVNVIDVIDVTAVAVNANGAAITVASPFSAVPTADCAWAYGQSAGAQPAKLFRVVSVKKSGDFNLEIGAIEYNELIYQDAIPNYGEIVGVPSVTPAIKYLTLTEQYQNGTLTGSTASAVVAVGWQNTNTAVGAQVQVQAGNGKPVVIGNIQGQGCTFVGYIGTTYLVTVTAMDWAGNLFGVPATASITVVASTNAPANVPSFTGYVSSGSTVLTRGAVTGADHYEIRYAPDPSVADWTTAEVMWDGTALTYTDAEATSGLYLIKAISSLATGSVESIAAATFQNNGISAGYNTNTVSALLASGTANDASGVLSFSIPAGTVYDAAGNALSVAAQTVTYPGTASGYGTTYTAYAYIDTTLTLHLIPSPSSASLPLTAASPADAAAAMSAGLVSAIVLWTTPSLGGVYNPRPPIYQQYP